MSWLNLEGKIAIVTGEACGIGKAVCEGLAEVGVNTVAADIDLENASKLTANLKKKYGGNHFVTATNVTDKANIDAMIHEALDAFGRIDIYTKTTQLAGGLRPPPLSLLCGPIQAATSVSLTTRVTPGSPDTASWASCF